ASLAALLNSPGALDPSKHPERLLARRDRVLSRMLELGWIHEDERKQALAEALSPAPLLKPSDSLPFALQAVQAELSQFGIADPDLVFTSLQSVSQLRTQNSLQKQIENLEKSEPRLRRNKEQGKSLEGLALTVDVASGQIEALVGGRHFRQSQFNRALFARRQIGSLMKPFVFLQALLAGKKASDLVDDSPFTHQWDRQSWSPVNYGGKYFGSVPLTFALANSLNCATARLSLDLGVEGLVQLMRQLGVTSALQPVPSLSLGSFEISALEVAQTYLTLARFGEFQQISSVRSWVDREGEKHLASRPSRRILPAPIVADLVAMMQETLNSGTAQSVRALGWKEPGAGKTGTTSDFKDSWFAGFSAKKLVLVWLGYDDNTPTGLTGGKGAVPVWTEIQKGFPPPGDFSWPYR
ncbi:MAG: penicillin-binding transpeptidase domain-containing protein, partial [Bdellovibrio sp.]